ncbi:MAG: hypothetical protein U0670_16930 [Anaerolineae bacterium]
MDALSTTNLSILFKAFEHSQSQVQHLRERVMSIHTWIGSILSAFIGLVAAFNPQQLSTTTASTRLLLSITIASLWAFAWLTELLSFRARVKEQQASVKIIRLLHLFDPDYFGIHSAVFDEQEWTGWTRNPLRIIGVSPSTAVLTVLSVVAVIFVWLA